MFPKLAYALQTARATGRLGLTCTASRAIIDTYPMNEHAQVQELISEPPSEARVDAKLSGAPGFAVKGLFILALFYTFYFARSLLLPIVLALLLSLILSPAVRALKRMLVPEPIGAAAVVAGLSAVLVWGLVQLFEPATDWLAKAPKIAEQVERKLSTLRKSVAQVTNAAAKVEELTTVEGETKRPTQVSRAPPSLVSRVFDRYENVVIAAGATLVLLYFILASGDLFMRETRPCAAHARRQEDGRRGRTYHQSAIARYLFTITSINVGLGVATAAAPALCSACRTRSSGA